MNILLIRLKSIGGVVLTLPAVNAIRDDIPTAKTLFLPQRKMRRCWPGSLQALQFRAHSSITPRAGGGVPSLAVPDVMTACKRVLDGEPAGAV